MKNISKFIYENTSKDLLSYIIESKGLTQDIKLLSNYIYEKIKNLVYDEPDDPSYKTYLYEYVKEYDEYELQINFKDIEGFENTHGLRSWRLQKEINAQNGEDFNDETCDYDLLVIISLDVPGYANIETNEPTLYINGKFAKSTKIFEKEKANIKNTLAHELTHYVQYQGNNDVDIDGVRFHNLKPNILHASKELRQGTDGNLRYYSINFILYAWNPLERDARRAGFYETVSVELEELLKKFKKLHKKDAFNREKFIDYVLYNEKYDDNVTHINVFSSFIEGLEKDTWENYLACINDTKNRYRDDSLLYVILNLCDSYDKKAPIPLPSKKNYVASILTEKRYNEYKEKLLTNFKKNFNKHKHKLVKVINTILDEQNIQ